MLTDDTHFYYVLGPALVVIVIASLIIRFRSSRQPTELHKAITQLRFGTLTTGAFLLVLWFLLPSTPVLSTFGYPQSVDDIQSSKRLLQYLQDYNKALVRLTMIVHWFIFVFIWWFLSTIYSLSKALTKLADDQKDKPYEKRVA
jgi:hypothetical protein